VARVAAITKSAEDPNFGLGLFKTLKREEVDLKDYQTSAEAEANLGHFGHFMEAVYNVKRLHSSLGYLHSVEFEAAYCSSMVEWTYPLVR
jgi:hypothetical protein